VFQHVPPPVLAKYPSSPGWVPLQHFGTPRKRALNFVGWANPTDMPLQTRAARVLLAGYLARRRRRAREGRYRGSVSEPREPVVVVQRARSFLPFVTGVLFILVMFFVFGWAKGLLPHFGNPFAERTVDRSRPAVLKTIANLHEYHAASGHYEVLVDLEKDTRFVPSFLKGERDLFVAVGSVDAIVDFDRLDDGDIQVSRDRRTATITLPHARLADVRVDPKRSYVYQRKRGLLDRVGSAFGENANHERELYILSEEKLRRAAQKDSSVLRRGERNTRATLEGMLQALGFTRVVVTFGPSET
jgi:hypothetical protein